MNSCHARHKELAKLNFIPHFIKKCFHLSLEILYLKDFLYSFSWLKKFSLKSFRSLFIYSLILLNVLQSFSCILCLGFHLIPFHCNPLLWNCYFSRGLILLWFLLLLFLYFCIKTYTSEFILLVGFKKNQLYFTWNICNVQVENQIVVG